ncbi:hypothetical protein [Streptomyces sp. NBC_00893]|uniref:hypothetical protein n=1 Tax=Streptomyces sp. NBC_00893 TaxID=2975862 RepID=UPI00224D288B|nr:hypothetical protein [Streptomyces sp. NBC_00893]MCX4847936.1 hypothetical protein [Streptomyces sp. NBC_00893]
MNWYSDPAGRPSATPSAGRPQSAPGHSQSQPAPPQPRPGLWKRCLWGGIALWLLTARGARTVRARLWTAIAGGVLLSFRKPNGRFRLAAPVIGTYLGVAVLHSLWDSMHGIAIWLVAEVTDTGLSRALFAQGYIPAPTDEQQHLFTVFSIGGMVVITLVALVWLRSLARGARGSGADGRPDARIHTP